MAQENSSKDMALTSMTEAQALKRIKALREKGQQEREALALKVQQEWDLEEEGAIRAEKLRRLKVHRLMAGRSKPSSPSPKPTPKPTE